MIVLITCVLNNNRFFLSSCSAFSSTAKSWPGVLSFFLALKILLLVEASSLWRTDGLTPTVANTVLLMAPHCCCNCHSCVPQMEKAQTHGYIYKEDILLWGLFAPQSIQQEFGWCYIFWISFLYFPQYIH